MMRNDSVKRKGESRFSYLRMVYRMRKEGTAAYAGNRRQKIYGLLSCSSGKRMNKENRVFFRSKSEAEAAGYRPCGYCLNLAYGVWKSTQGSPYVKDQV